MSKKIIKFRGLTIKTKRWCYGGVFHVGKREFIVLDDCEILDSSDIGSTKLDFFIEPQNFRGEKMSCIGCSNWKFNGEPSRLEIDLLYGFCSEKQKETAHDYHCERYKEILENPKLQEKKE